MTTKTTKKTFIGIRPELINQPSLIKQHSEVDWTTGFAFECFGVRIGILATAGMTIDNIRLLLPPFSVELESNQVDRVFLVKINQVESILFEDDFEKLRFPGTEWVAEALRGQLKYAVSRLTSEKVFVHAGVVAWQDCLILMPGAGFAGKTTLTAELVKAGADYYSDDFAVIDENGLVYPYPKPLSMRQRGATTGEQIDYEVGYFGGVQATEPLAAKLIVITEYQAGARWQPKTLTPGQGFFRDFKAHK